MTVFVYHQASGEFYAEEKLLARGYSGQPPHVNVAADEWMHALGPIPRGEWIVGKAIDSAQLGPVAVPLTPTVQTRTFGREGFFVHGDSKVDPGRASHGCIIMPRDVREILAVNVGAVVRVV